MNTGYAGTPRDNHGIPDRNPYGICRVPYLHRKNPYGICRVQRFPRQIHTDSVGYNSFPDSIHTDVVGYKGIPDRIHPDLSGKVGPPTESIRKLVGYPVFGFASHNPHENLLASLSLFDVAVCRLNLAASLSVHAVAVVPFALAGMASSRSARAKSHARRWNAAPGAAGDPAQPPVFPARVQRTQVQLF